MTETIERHIVYAKSRIAAYNKAMEDISNTPGETAIVFQEYYKEIQITTNKRIIRCTESIERGYRCHKAFIDTRTSIADLLYIIRPTILSLPPFNDNGVKEEYYDGRDYEINSDDK